MTQARPAAGSPRAFVVLPEGQPEPSGVRVVGRIDRFDLAVPIAARIGADILVLSEHMVDAEDGWDAVRGMSRSANVAIWVVADGNGRNRDRWRDLASRVLSPDGVTAAQGCSFVASPSEDRDLVLVLGAKGGVGKTFISANLVHAAAVAGLAVAAVDLDVETGDLGLRLGMDPGIQLAGIQGTVQAIPRTWVTAKPGMPLKLLASKPRPEFAGALDEALTGLILDEAVANSHCVVVDTPSDPDSPAVCAALDRASSIVLVSTLNPGSVRQARIMVDLLKRLNIPVRDRLLVVVNRYSRRAPVDAAGFRDLVGHDPKVIIGDIGVAADLEAYAGCPTMGSRYRKRIADPVLALARAVFRLWPSGERTQRRIRFGLPSRRKREPGYALNDSRGWM